MIHWQLQRKYFGIGTLGMVTLDNGLSFYSLEPKKRSKGKPRAIPAGTYKLEWHNSPTFGRVIELQGIPDFSLVYFHAGNKVSETRGCILPGMLQNKRDFMVLQSRKALAQIESRFEYLLAKGETVFLTVLD